MSGVISYNQGHEFINRWENFLHVASRGWYSKNRRVYSGLVIFTYWMGYLK